MTRFRKKFQFFQISKYKYKNGLPLMRSFCNTNVHAQEASAANIGTGQLQCHLT